MFLKERKKILFIVHCKTPVCHVSTIILFSEEAPSFFIYGESKFAIRRHALQQSDYISASFKQIKHTAATSDKTRLPNQPPDANRSEFQLKTGNVKRLHMIRRKQN
jgi:hypothetical protein